MKKFLAVWYDYSRMNYKEFEAMNIEEARGKAFRAMCDSAGDKIYNVMVYELKYVCSCEGEYNPSPYKWCTDYSDRDYQSGKRINKKRKVKK